MWGLNWADVPTILGTIATLVLLEGLLSADNALVLAVMVQHLPKPQQKRALRYGIWGAFLFRAIAVVFAFQLIQYWQIKLLGGLYLFALAVRHFLTHKGDDATDPAATRRRGQGLWWTVFYVELADIAFSIDSILAAVALVEALPHNLQEHEGVALSIIYAGGVLGIIMMRLVAGMFLVLLNRYKGLVQGAYILVGWIGLKLMGSGIHSAFHNAEQTFWHAFAPLATAGASEIAIQGTPVRDWITAIPHSIKELPWELPDWLFWIGMALIVVASLVYKPKHAASKQPTPSQSPET